MSATSQPVITRAEERPREAWGDPERGSVTWYTLFSSDITPTDSLCGGIAEVAPGSGGVLPHRHAEPEIYLILEGTGILTIDGKDSIVTKGSVVFIPGNAWHVLRNEAKEDLKLFYVFPTGRFGDVVYEFPS
jgi:mannose-6-phosphate isomerase-like protein (cupin superfamily)